MRIRILPPDGPAPGSCRTGRLRWVPVRGFLQTADVTGVRVSGEERCRDHVGEEVGVHEAGEERVNGDDHELLQLTRKHLEEFVDGERLLQQKVAVVLAFRPHFGQVVNAGEKDEGSIAVVGHCTHVLMELNPVHMRHPDVRHYDVDRLLLKQFEPFGAICGNHDRMAQAIHDFLEHLEILGFVFHGKNAHRIPQNWISGILKKIGYSDF